jgi:hypothetical protein
MPLIVLGLIAVVAAGMLIYYSLPKKASPQHKGPDRLKPHNYEKSEDGKVVFLHNHSVDKNGENADAKTDQTEGSSDDDKDADS